MARRLASATPIFCFSAFAAATLSGGPLADPASGQGAAQSCTQQWLARRATLPPAQRYDRARADAFGRQCLGVTGRVPIDWTAAERDLSATIGADHPLTKLVPADIAVFCPEYVHHSPTDRAAFWRAFALAVIKPEAGTDAHALMWEQPRDRSGKPSAGGEYSIGLLQLSISNRRPYGCDLPDEASLLDPHRNLACGVKILTRRVGEGRIGGDEAHGRVGVARYWSTVRVVSQKPGASGGQETRQPIIHAMRALPECR